MECAAEKRQGIDFKHNYFSKRLFHAAAGSGGTVPAKVISL
jgi:hypothetical protein